MARRARYEEDDEDDRPRRRRDDDEDDDRPRRRCRYEEEDRPRKRPQGRPTLLIFGILGGVALVCSGIGGFVYFELLLPRIEAAKQKAASQPPPNQMLVRPTDPKLSQLRKGMTKAEVEAILGPLRPAERKDVSYVIQVLPDAHQVRQRWGAFGGPEHLYCWRAGRDCVLVSFDFDPAAGGKLSAVLASMESSGFHGELNMLEHEKK